MKQAKTSHRLRDVIGPKVLRYELIELQIETSATARRIASLISYWFNYPRAARPLAFISATTGMTPKQPCRIEAEI